jgi:nitrogen fixation-related uncharacterized protein
MRFCSEDRSENCSETREILLFLHCWVKDEFRKMTNKAWQRVWSTSVWQNKMRFRRFSSISSFSFFVDVYDSSCFEHHEALHILRILFWWWTFDKRFFDDLILRIHRILRSKDIDFRCDHIVNNCNIVWFCSYERISRTCEFRRLRRNVVEWLRWSSRRKWISVRRWFVRLRRERLSSVISCKQFLSQSILIFSSYLHQSTSRWRLSCCDRHEKRKCWFWQNASKSRKFSTALWFRHHTIWFIENVDRETSRSSFCERKAWCSHCEDVEKSKFDFSMSYWCSRTFVTFSSCDRSSCSSSRRSEWMFCSSDVLWRSCCNVWSSHSDSSRRFSSSLSILLSDSQSQIWRSTEKKWFLSDLDACDWFLSARAEDRRSLIEHEFWWSSSSNNQRSSKRVSWASSSDFSLNFDEVVAHAREDEYNAHLRIM